MNHYEAVNILDMLNAIGEDAVKNILSDFSCPKNFEIESFVKQNALEFAKRKMSITYLVIDEEGQLAAIFALTHKAVQLTNEGLSGSMEDIKSGKINCIIVKDLSRLGRNYIEIDGGSAACGRGCRDVCACPADHPEDAAVD